MLPLLKLMPLLLTLSAQAQITPAGTWTCKATCEGPKREDKKAHDRAIHSEKRCVGKGKTFEDAVSDLRTKLSRDSSNDTTHAPVYECDGCVKTDLDESICKDENGNTHPYREVIKTRSLPGSRKSTP